MRAIVTLIVAALIAAGLAACSEKPQDLSAAREPGGQTDKHQLRERGQTQNESNRIYY